MPYRFSFLISLLLVVGCVPSLSKSELGTVEFELPKVAGADQPYPMPQLGAPLKDEDRQKYRLMR